MSTHSNALTQPPRKMVRAGVQCPKCMSSRVYGSSKQITADYLLSLIGIKALRCHQCFHRFRRIWP